MADNVVLNAGVGGDTVAADDVGGAKYQRVKLSLGADGTAADAPVGGGVESGTLRVTIASDSTGVLSVDDNGGALTVDGTVELGATTLAALETVSVTDGGGSLTVDGTVELGATSLAALESLTTITTVTTVGAVTSLTNALPAGTNNIGDVDVLSIVPGTAATSLGKAEDAAHTSGDVGVMALAVRRDADTTLAATDGDYVPLQCNAAGSLKVAITAGAGSGGTSIADGASFTRDTTSITPVGGVVEASAPTVTAGDAVALSLTTGGAVRVAVASGGIAGVVEDAASAGGEEGIMILAVRRDSASSGVGADGDFAALSVTSDGSLRVSSGAGGTSVTDDAAFTVGSGSATPAAGYYNSTRDSVDSGDAGVFAMSARRAQYTVLDNVTSTANSTTANLANGAVFTGTAEDMTDYSVIQVSVFSSHASATDGLSLQQSSDATNWDITDVYTVAAATGRPYSVPVQARYYRLVYTNGGTLTTSLRIQTVFKVVGSKGSSQRPGDALSNENDFEMMLNFLMGYNGATWDRLRSDTTNGLDVDVTRVIPGTTATALGKAEDAAHTTGDTGVMALAVRTDTLAASSGTTADYEPLHTDSIGALWTRASAELADDAAFTPATSRVLPAGFFADETATDSVDEGDIGAARITLDRKQIVTPYVHAAAGGTTNYTALSTAAVLTAEIKSSAGKVFSLECFNINAAARFVRLYNQTGAPASTDTANVVWQGVIPGATTGGGFTISWPMGKQFATGIGIRATTGIAHNDTGALAANELTFNVSYA